MLCEPINTSRRALVPFVAVRGDTWTPGGISFSADIDGVVTPEDFSTCTLAMNITNNGKLVKQLTIGSGITIDANVLQFTISAADMAAFKLGIYQYEVKKTIDPVVSTILYGTINVLE